LGVTPDVEVSQRASKVLEAHREESSHRVWELGTVVAPRGDELWWWTWAGGSGNASLAAALDHVVDIGGQPENHRLLPRTEVDPAELRAALDNMEGGELPRPWSQRKRHRG